MKTLPPEVIKAVYDKMPDFIAHRLTASAKIERILTQLIENIDWHRTRVFSTGGVQANFYLNNPQNGRTDENNGGEELLEQLREELADLRHPTTNERIRTI